MGAIGESSDAPDDPATTDLTEALTGDLAATGPDRFIEVTVGGESPLTRTQVLAVPYALRAASAATAESADTATTAATALTVGGLDATFVTQLFEHSNHDGKGPPNNDPSEGLADVDGDGLANFIDQDNDNDGLDDSFEISFGSDINLVSPRVNNIVPSTANAFEVNSVVANGTGFDPSMTVLLDGEVLSPSSITANQITVDVGPQAPGSFGFEVIRLNGERHTRSLNFTAVIASISHNVAVDASTQGSLDIKSGGNALMAGNDVYATNPESVGGFPSFPFPSHGASQLAVRFTPAGDRAGVRCLTAAGGVDCDVELRIDSNGNSMLTDETPVLIESLAAAGTDLFLSPSLRFEADGSAAIGYVKVGGTTSTAVVAHDRDGNGDFLGTNERVDIEAAAALSNSGELALDSSGRAAYAYARDAGGGAFDVRVAYDRSGDGDFDDTVGGNSELFTAETVTIGQGGVLCIGLAFDASDHLVLGFANDRAPRLLIDTSGDGDFGDRDADFDSVGEDIDFSAVIGNTTAPMAITLNPDTGSVQFLRSSRLISDPASD